MLFASSSPQTPPGGFETVGPVGGGGDERTSGRGTGKSDELPSWSIRQTK